VAESAAATPADEAQRASKLKPKSRLGSLAPTLTAILPLIVAIGFHIAGPRPSHSAPGKPKPPLAFHQYSVNLGEVEARPRHFGRFIFTNRSDQSIELRELETSCGCLSGHLDRKIIAPGQQSEFFLWVTSANQPVGPRNYTCTVIYGPEGQTDIAHRTDLQFLLTLPERSVTLNPRLLLFRQPNDTPTTRFINVTDLRDRPLTVLGAVCDPPLPEISVIAPTEIPRSDREDGAVSQIKVTVGAVPPGKHECMLTIQTTDPDFEYLKVPIQIHGPNRTDELPPFAE
jgi:hypothetical protein